MPVYRDLLETAMCVNAPSCAGRKSACDVHCNPRDKGCLGLSWAAASQLQPGGNHDTKPRLPAHHAVVGFGDALQRKNFVHGPHSGARLKGERVLRVDRASGIPAFDRLAPPGAWTTERFALARPLPGSAAFR